VRRRQRPSEETPPVDEWAGVPVEVLEAAQRDWWSRYDQLRALWVNPAPWLAANPFPGARPGERYAHLRRPAG